MTTDDLRGRFNMSASAAAQLAPLVEAARQRPPRISRSERARRAAILPDIAGTLRIEGLTLTLDDQRFHAFVHELGLADDDAGALIRAYALATARTERLQPAE